MARKILDYAVGGNETSKSKTPTLAANAFAKGLSGGAPFVALVLLLPAPIAALNSFLRKRRRNSQK